MAGCRPAAGVVVAAAVEVARTAAAYTAAAHTRAVAAVVEPSAAEAEEQAGLPVGAVPRKPDIPYRRAALLYRIEDRSR